MGKNGSSKKPTFLIILAILMIIAAYVLVLCDNNSQPTEVSKLSAEESDKLLELYLKSSLTSSFGSNESNHDLTSPWIAVRIPANTESMDEWKVIGWNQQEISEEAMSRVQMVVFCECWNDSRIYSMIPGETDPDKLYHVTSELVDIYFCDAHSDQTYLKKELGRKLNFQENLDYFSKDTYFKVSDEDLFKSVTNLAPKMDIPTSSLRILGMICYFSGLLILVFLGIRGIIRKAQKKAA